MIIQLTIFNRINTVLSSFSGLKICFCIFLFCIAPLCSSGQKILNGDFENNSATGDLLNLNNTDFSFYMDDAYAFGSGNEIDIIESNVWCGSPQNGNWFISLAHTVSSVTDAMALALSGPFIAGKTYTISYYDRACFSVISGTYLEVGVSTSANNFGTLVHTSPLPSNSVWTKRTFSFVAPITASYLTLRASNTTAAGKLGWTHIDNMQIGCAFNLDIGNDTLLCDGQTVVVGENIAGATYLWNDNSTSATYQVSSEGDYWVEVNSAGCTTRDTIHVSYEYCCSGFTLPNLITPNKDGHNDSFEIGCLDIPNWEFEVYNTWGVRIYHDKNYKNTWNGSGLSDGIYYYYLHNESLNDEYKGWVQLVR